MLMQHEILVKLLFSMVCTCAQCGAISFSSRAMSILRDFLGRMTGQWPRKVPSWSGDWWACWKATWQLPLLFAQQVKPRPPPMQNLQLDTEGAEAAEECCRMLSFFQCAAPVDTRAVRMISWGRQS